MREFHIKFGQDISDYVPNAVLELNNEEKPDGPYTLIIGPYYHFYRFYSAPALL